MGKYTRYENRGLRMLMCALAYVIASIGIIWHVSFFAVGWPDTPHLVAYAVRDLFISLPRSLAFWTPLVAIEIATLIWRPHPISKKRDGILTILLVITAIPTVLFMMVTYIIFYAYVHYHLFLYYLVFPAFILGLCMPLFCASLILIARGKTKAVDKRSKFLNVDN